MIDKSTEPYIEPDLRDETDLRVADFEGCFNSFLSLTAAQVENIVNNWPEDL